MTTSTRTATKTLTKTVKTHTKLGWTRQGTGEPLVMLHGIGSTRADFALLAPRLAEDYEVLTVDVPGHGGSRALGRRLSTVSGMADALEADLDAMGFSRVHLLGNSLGGSAGTGARASTPRPLSRRHLAVRAGAARRAHLPVRGDGRRQTARSLLLAGLRARPAEASQAEARAVKGGFAEATGFWRMLWWTVIVDVPTGLQHVDCPVILAQGTRDLVAAGQTPRYLLAVPGARLQPIKRAGHAPHSDAPEEIVALVHEAMCRSSTASP